MPPLRSDTLPSAVVLEATIPRSQRKIAIYADGASASEMLAAYRSGAVQGFTTNPTLMRKAGLTDYAAFAREALSAVPDLPVSFEVFADEFDEMARQARVIASWGPNVYVKIPVTNTRGESACELIRALSAEGILLNVTAILSLPQVQRVVAALSLETPAIVSVFAGRVADTGRDPVALMRDALALLAPRPKAQLLWASPREVLNVVQAEAIGCHIITLTPELLKKLPMLGQDLEALSLETVAMFRADALAAGFTL